MIIASRSLPSSFSRTLEFGLARHGKWGMRGRGQFLRLHSDGTRKRGAGVLLTL